MPAKRSTGRKQSARSRPSPGRRAKAAGRPKTRRSTANRWSAEVTEHSDALDLEQDVFKGSAKAIAQSLKRSAEQSRRRKSSPYRSAMSMLTFYINRAGTNLSASRRRTLETAKSELRKAFGKTAP